MFLPAVFVGSSFSTLLPALLTVFVNLSVLVGVKWCHILVLIFVSPLANDVELLFMCLLVICISSLEKCLFRPFAHFILDYLYFWTIRVFYIACQYLFKYMICRYLPFCRLSSLIVSFQPHVCSVPSVVSDSLGPYGPCGPCGPPQVPLSMKFSRQGYCSRLPCSPPGDLLTPGPNPHLVTFSALAGGSLPLVPPGKPHKHF